MGSKTDLVRTLYFKPFIKVMSMHSLPIDKLCAQVGINTDLLEKDDNLIFERKVHQLIALASKYDGLQNIGFITAEQTPFSEYGYFFIQLLSQKSLKDMLKYFVKHLNTQSNSLSYWLKEHRGNLWVCRPGTASFTDGSWQVEQHVMSLIVKLIRVYIGPKWSPLHLGIQSINDSGSDEFDFFENTIILPGQSFSSISIESKYLTRKPKASNINYLKSSKDEKVADNFVKLLEQLLIQKYFGDKWSAQQIAGGMNMSVSTLKRKLACYDTCLRDVLDNVRYSQAKIALKRSNIDIDTLAKQLGYAHTENFNRAFKRWSGTTPKKYHLTQLVS